MGTSLHYANLNGADSTGADLTDADLTNAVISPGVRSFDIEGVAGLDWTPQRDWSIGTRRRWPHQSGQSQS